MYSDWLCCSSNLELRIFNTDSSILYICVKTLIILSQYLCDPILYVRETTSIRTHDRNNCAPIVHDRGTELANRAAPVEKVVRAVKNRVVAQLVRPLNVVLALARSFLVVFDANIGIHLAGIYRSPVRHLDSIPSIGARTYNLFENFGQPHVTDLRRLVLRVAAVNRGDSLTAIQSTVEKLAAGSHNHPSVLAMI